MQQYNVKNKWDAWKETPCFLFTHWIFPVVKGSWSRDWEKYLSFIHPGSAVPKLQSSYSAWPYKEPRLFQSINIRLWEQVLGDLLRLRSPYRDCFTFRDNSGSMCALRNPIWCFNPLTDSFKPEVITTRTYLHVCLIYFTISGWWFMVTIQQHKPVPHWAPMISFGGKDTLLHMKQAPCVFDRSCSVFPVGWPSGFCLISRTLLWCDSLKKGLLFLGLCVTFFEFWLESLWSMCDVGWDLAHIENGTS